MVSIEKNSIVTILRRNQQVLDNMKVQWTKFLVKRMANKVSVDQIVVRTENKRLKDKALES